MKEFETSAPGNFTAAQAKVPFSSTRRILVVDDDICIRQLSTAMLVRSGYQVDAAQDGAAAWEALQLNQYDLVITDNNMPNVTGLQLLKTIRAARMTLPIIMATGTLPTKEFGVNPGIAPEATLLKPYTVPEFLSTVERVLKATDSAVPA